MSISSTKNANVNTYWHNHPFKYGVDVANACRVDVGTALSRYPHPQYHEDFTFRQRQAAHCLTLYPGKANADLTPLTGISAGPLKIARDYLEKGIPPPKRKRKHQKRLAAVASPAPQQVAEPQTEDPRSIDVAKLTTERGSQYGHPLDDFKRVAAGKEVLAACLDPEVRHALEMIWVKVCRLVVTPDHKDSIDDIAGYAETIHMVHAERARRG